MKPYNEFIKLASKHELEYLEGTVNPSFMKDALRSRKILESLLVSKEQGFTINRCNDEELIVSARDWLQGELGVTELFWTQVESMIKTLTKLIADDI